MVGRLHLQTSTPLGVLVIGLDLLKGAHTVGASRSTGLVALLSLIVVVALASSGAALEQAAGLRVTTGLDGVRGNQGIRTNPATVNGVGYVHPTQMDVGSLGDSFVAIGTSNGAGTNVPGAQNCANDYDTNWSGYYDGEIAGVYFCQLFAQDNWGANTNPSFRIERDCPLGGNIGWGLYFAGSQRACIDSGASGAAFAGAGLETTGSSTTDRNIDVKYTSLDVNFTGSSTWQVFDNNSSFADPNYTFARVCCEGTAFNTFLSPLD